MNNIIWKPTQEHLTESRIARFMKKHDIADYKTLIQRSQQDTEWFWHEALKDLGVEWYRPYSKILEGGLPFAKWFIDGQINIVHQCIDRHVLPASSGRGGLSDKTAFIWEGDCGAVKKITYGQLHDQVNRFASGLLSLGAKKGDRVGLYMPMILEMVVAFFATLKIGAVPVPVFSGFGPEPTSIRLSDAKVEILVTADGSFRRGKKIEIKKLADQAVQSVASIRHVVVAKRLFEEVPWTAGRDIWFDDLLRLGDPQTPTAVLDAEDVSLIIYTSGTTGKPKGTVHTHAGALAQIAKEVSYNMDCKVEDVFFWVTDIGWMMGPWEMIGSTFNGATCVIFEGAPDWPEVDRLWDIVQRHQVSILGLSPTAIRVLKKNGLQPVQKHNFDSLRILGSTGETWDPESYQWFFEHIGQSRCPIINISGGTEIMGCHLAPLPICELKPCTLGGPGLGMDVDVFDEEGKSLRGEVGYLVCKKPAPSMTKGFLNDPQRYLDTYFNRWTSVWNHGDWAYVDEDGFWFLRGRADDVIKVSGHRTGPAEIESALMVHAAVAECAAIGVPHEIKGESIVAFVVLKPTAVTEESLCQETLCLELKSRVAEKLGKTLVPDVIEFVGSLPKTRSAKIVRAAIKKKYLGFELGDISSIENPESLEKIGNSL